MVPGDMFWGHATTPHQPSVLCALPRPPLASQRVVMASGDANSIQAEHHPRHNPPAGRRQLPHHAVHDGVYRAACTMCCVLQRVDQTHARTRPDGHDGSHALDIADMYTQFRAAARRTVPGRYLTATSSYYHEQLIHSLHREQRGALRSVSAVGAVELCERCAKQGRRNTDRCVAWTRLDAARVRICQSEEHGRRGGTIENYRRNYHCP